MRQNLARSNPRHVLALTADGMDQSKTKGRFLLYLYCYLISCKLSLKEQQMLRSYVSLIFNSSYMSTIPNQTDMAVLIDKTKISPKYLKLKKSKESPRRYINLILTQLALKQLMGLCLIQSTPKQLLIIKMFPMTQVNKLLFYTRCYWKCKKCWKCK